MEIGGPLKQPHVNVENDQFKKPHVAHHRDIFWEDSLCFIDPQIRIQRLMWMLAGAFFLGGHVPRAVTRLNPTRASCIASIRQCQNDSTILLSLRRTKATHPHVQKITIKLAFPLSPKTSPHRPFDSSPLPPPPPPPP